MARWWLALGAAWFLTACESEAGEGAASVEPGPAAEPSEPAPPPEPPEAPALDDLDAPAEGRATVAAPRWNAERRWLEHEVVDVPAKFGRSDGVVQILLGDDPADGTMLTFYGRGLAPGEYRVLPANDETRAEHAGRDSDVFILVVGRPGAEDVRSESGTVRIAEASADRIRGSFDVVVESEALMASGPARARFDARRDQYMDALLEHEAAIREQLRRR